MKRPSGGLHTMADTAYKLAALAAFLVFAFYLSTAVASLQKCHSFSWKGPELVSGWDNHYWCAHGEAGRYRR
jgi:hypothetical protein